MVSGGSSRVLRSYIRSHKVAAGGPSSTPPRRRSSSGLPLQHGFQQAAFATSGTAVLNLPPHLPMASSKVWTMRILGQLQRPASAPGIWSLAQLWRMWTRSCFFSSFHVSPLSTTLGRSTAASAVAVAAAGQVARLRSRPNRFCSSGHRAKSNSLNDVGFSPSPLPKPLQRGSACCDAARQNGARIDDLSVSSL
eukprot:s611_g3.t2